MLPDHLYACVRRDEVWHLRGSEWRLRERRAEQGHALTIARSDGLEIRASDDFSHRFTSQFSDPAQLYERLSPADDDSGRFRALVSGLRNAVLRIVTHSRYVENEERSDFWTARSATIETGNLSITTDLEHASEHLALLSSLSGSRDRERTDYRPYPMLWRHGSAAVLLHEAIGHPAERSLFAEWPQWLRVVDAPPVSVDDTGQLVATRCLTGRQQPAAFRRESFRSVPVRRMTQFVVSAEESSLELPEPRLEVLLVSGGNYDALTDLVRLEVSAARLVDRGAVREVEPFDFIESREDIRRRLMRAIGPAAVYPGVICADEGQRLPVGSVAPDILTSAMVSS